MSIKNIKSSDYSNGGLMRVLKVAGEYKILGIALIANIAEGVSKVLIASHGGKMLDSIILFEHSRALSNLIWILVFSVVMAVGIIIKDSFLGIYLEKV